MKLPHFARWFFPGHNSRNLYRWTAQIRNAQNSVIVHQLQLIWSCICKLIILLLVSGKLFLFSLVYFIRKMRTTILNLVCYLGSFFKVSPWYDLIKCSIQHPGIFESFSSRIANLLKSMTTFSLIRLIMVDCKYQDCFKEVRRNTGNLGTELKRSI